EYPEYAKSAQKVTLLETSSGDYYGDGYQDVQHRVPNITNTRKELQWEPSTAMADALRHIFDAYRDQVATAKALIDPCR
ncbi:MAG TPA: bifunctional UDP-4-keto-pentose/UDP-xylose synthase, partial [Noviherbaspirillum sp.]|nr:bifunctional UDP-4-keto-pentose/UDP-xylose synthase [Noviherbaspirillum sp.]